MIAHNHVPCHDRIRLVENPAARPRFAARRGRPPCLAGARGRRNAGQGAAGPLARAAPALLAAIDDPTEAPVLDRFPLWHDTPAVAWEAPWPEDDPSR